MAARTYTFRLTSEGVKELERDLKALGPAGVQAFEQISQKSPQLANALRKAREDADSLRGRLESFGTGISGFVGGISSGVRSLLSWKSAIASAIGIAGGYGLVHFVNSSLDAAGALVDLSKATGVSTDALQAFRFQASQSGVAAAEADGAFRTFTKNMGQLQEGTGRLSAFLEKSNDSLRKQLLTAQGSDEAFRIYANAIQKAGSETEATALAAAAFGDIGSKLVPILRDGTKGIDEYAARAKELGLVLDENLLRTADEAGDKLDALWQVIGAKLTNAVIELAPEIDHLAQEITDGLPDLLKWTEEWAKWFGLIERSPVEALEKQIASVQKIIQSRDSISAFVQGNLIPGGDPLVNQLETLKRQLQRADLGSLALTLDAQRRVGATSPSPVTGFGTQGAGDFVDPLAARKAEADLERVRKERERGIDTIQEQIQALKDEAEELKVTGRERAVLKARLEAEETARRSGLDVQSEQIQALIAEKEAAAGVAYELDQLDKERQEAARKAEREAEQTAKKQAEALEAPFKHAAENIQDALGDAIFNAFDKGIDSAEDFADEVLRIGKRLAAEWLTLQVFGPQISGISAAGSAGAAPASGGGGGLGGVLGSLGQIFNLGSGPTATGGLDLGGLNLGTGALIYSLGSTIATTIVDLFGKELSPSSQQATGAIGGLLGGITGALYGLFFGKGPSNQAAGAHFDTLGNLTEVEGSKATEETLAAVKETALAIQQASSALQSTGAVTFNKVLEVISLGTRDPSYFKFFGETGQRTGAVGDPAELALSVLKEQLKSATFTDANVEKVLKGKDFKSLEELTETAAFVIDVYSAIVDGKPQLNAVEQAMKSLTASMAAARVQAKELGLSVEALDAGFTRQLDEDNRRAILQLTDPLAAALEDFERGAEARRQVIEDANADIALLEQRLGLEREAILKQYNQSATSSLKGLVDDLLFGSQSAFTPEQKFFTASSRLNLAERTALENPTATNIQDFQDVAQSTLPILREFLGTSEQYADAVNKVLKTATTLGGDAADPSGLARAFTNSIEDMSGNLSASLDTSNQYLKSIWDELRRLSEQIIAQNRRAANS